MSDAWLVAAIVCGLLLGLLGTLAVNGIVALQRQLDAYWLGPAAIMIGLGGAAVAAFGLMEPAGAPARLAAASLAWGAVSVLLGSLRLSYAISGLRRERSSPPPSKAGRGRSPISAFRGERALALAAVAMGAALVFAAITSL